MDTIYQKLNDDVEILHNEKPRSEIKEFYKGKTIFLTGCTGFVGKCLVEKLLRTCCDIKKLYLLMRPKKDKEVDERTKDYFNDIFFEPLKKINPNFLTKVEIIVGDLSLPGINLSPKDRQLLIETVDMIIHNASLVIFSARLSTALTINVLGTKEMLDLAAECHHLKSFMYISTAYSHCYMDNIEEKFYPEVADLKRIQEIINADLQTKNGFSNDEVNSIIHPWPNTYTYSKAMAEGVVHSYVKKMPFPCGVYRMSIVLSTYQEPLTNWCANLNGIVGIVTMIGLGLAHVIFFKRNLEFDVVPADMVANAGWVMVWDLTENQKDSKEGVVYNYGSSTVNPLATQDFCNKVYMGGTDAVSAKTMWKVYYVMCHDYRVFMIFHTLLHIVPAIIADIILLLRMKKRKFTPMLSKINKHLDGIMYFAQITWRIRIGRMIKIWDRMNLLDNELFFCDLRKLNWDDYFNVYWRGIRVYLLKDPMDNVDESNRRYDMLNYLHYSLVLVFSLLVGYILYKISDAFFL